MAVSWPLPGQRSPSYLIGGAAPYGYSGTPPDKASWVPAIPDYDLHGTEVALYERNDWDAMKGPADLVNQYQNPPFIGVGNTGTMPKYMEGSKILRGYARRLDYVDFNLPNLSAKDKARNTRLFFMYNPAEIQRQYLSYADTAGIKSLDVSDPASASTPAFTTTTVSIELFFDRGEEVMMYKDHPGVLLDLAVFDMLAGQMPFTATDINMLQQKYLATQTDVDPKINAQATADYLKGTQSLMVDTSMRLAFVMSPNLMFQGTIQSASALFQKFSHRMTPTRMTLSLTLLVTYTGQQFNAGPYDPSKQQSTADSQTKMALLSDATSAYDVASKADADQFNYDGRYLAVDWASSWTTVPPALKAVPYDANNRTGNYLQDKFDNRADAAHSPDGIDHQPSGFDCSSFVFRSYAVLSGSSSGASASVGGWPQHLHLDKGIATVSQDFYTAANDHPDQWSGGPYVLSQSSALASQQGGSPTNLPPSDSDYDSFNWAFVPKDQVADAKKKDALGHGPGVGDILIKSGVGDHGHAVMIHHFISQGTQPGQWQWAIIEAANADSDVYIGTFTTAQLFSYSGVGFTWLLRPSPIKGST